MEEKRDWEKEMRQRGEEYRDSEEDTLRRADRREEIETVRGEDKKETVRKGLRGVRGQ